MVDYEFFTGFLDWPRGPVQYVAAFLSPMLMHDWLGALVLTFLATLVCLVTHQLCVVIAGVGDCALTLIPAVLILLLLGQYIHVVEVCVGLFVVLVLANAYIRMGNTHDAVRLAVFLIGSATAYYVTGGLYLVFANVCGVFEFGSKRCRLLGVLCLACAALVPMAGAWLFDLNISHAYGGFRLSRQHWLAVPSSALIAVPMNIGLPVFFPVAAIVLVRRRRRTDSPVSDSEKQTSGPPAAKGAHASDSPSSSLRLVVQFAAFVVSVVAADFVLFDSPKNCLLQMVCAAEHQEWTDLLTHIGRLPASDPRRMDVRTGFHINRALYFNGDLLDRMFEYPQTLNSMTLAFVPGDISTMALTTPRQCSDILYELGRINESEHMAHEALEGYGARPRILKRLIYINVLKGRPEAARRFLLLMERSLLHNKWAHRCNRQLDIDPLLSSEPSVASRRELMVVQDSVDDHA